MKRKQIFTALMVVAVMVSLTACGKAQNTSEADSSINAESQSEEAEAEADAAREESVREESEDKRDASESEDAETKQDSEVSETKEDKTAEADSSENERQDDARTQEEESSEMASEDDRDAEAESSNAAKEASDGIRSEFKEAMDSYEAFYDEYCELLKKYTENPSDLKLLGEYADMVQKSAEMTEKFEAWESEEMSNEELLYYLEVHNRITQKLLEASM